MHPAHTNNITAKADRALTAIETIVATMLIDDTDIPEITDIDSGVEWMYDRLYTGSPATAAGWWASVGIMDTHLTGRTAHGVGDLTTYRTSKPFLRDLLEMRIEAAHLGQTADPFAGLAF